MPPIRFVLIDTIISSCANTHVPGCRSRIDGKLKQNRKPLRVVNALENAAASILIDSYEEDWSRLWWIRAQIEISVVELAEASTNVQETAAEVVGKLEAKYPQYGSTEVLPEPATMLSMSPTSWTSWCASEASFPRS
jgi:hypothetical protein